MHAQRRRRMLIATVMAGASILALLITIGVYGLILGPASVQPQAAPAAASSVASGAPPIAQPRPVSAGTDSETFARAAAMTVFRWDTRSPAGPSEWAQILMDVADPEEAAGLASDIRGYVPSIEQWEQLKVYGTRQRLAIDSAYVPDAWTTALAQAAPGQLPPGAVAYTISGQRHRDGMWDDEPIATSSAVTFTVFIACPRSQDCRLLRLSRLNEPLE
ncbi:hypothetical protein ABZ477_03980 [Microbacterium sp. NPDC019599]|uniref:hypothetical protein n=1 Tax=Microbacterium sp. NPDC019599 TaxID=3154690 RepID=UPI0033F30297